MLLHVEHTQEIELERLRTTILRLKSDIDRSGGSEEKIQLLSALLERYCQKLGQAELWIDGSGSQCLRDADNPPEPANDDSPLRFSVLSPGRTAVFTIDQP